MTRVSACGRAARTARKGTPGAEGGGRESRRRAGQRTMGLLWFRKKKKHALLAYVAFMRVAGQRQAARKAYPRPTQRRRLGRFELVHQIHRLGGVEAKEQICCT